MLIPSAPGPSGRSTSAVIAFFVLVCLWSWGLWAISGWLKPSSPTLSTALFLAGSFGPGFAAVAVVLGYEGVAGLRCWLRQCLNWRISWHWYALAALVPPLIMAVALAIHLALGGIVPEVPVGDAAMMAIAQFPLIVIFGGPLGEEFGWRGYALPALSKRLGWRKASLIIGAAWALWHLPLLLIPGSAQAELPIALFVISTIGLSVVMARLSVDTGFSILPAILLHSVINWCSMVAPIMPPGGDARAYSIVAGITIVFALVAFVKSRPNSPRPLPIENAPSC